MLQYFFNQNKLTVYFKDASPKTIQSLFFAILAQNEITMKPYVLIWIEGLDVTIEEFVKNCHSTNYCIYDNGRWKWFAKYLPTLCLITDCVHDINTFIGAKDAFSEGSMSLFSIDPKFTPFSLQESTKDTLLDQVKSIANLCVEMFPDGEGLEASLYSGEYCFDRGKRLIITRIKSGRPHDWGLPANRDNSLCRHWNSLS